jgi:PAS domain S-box-containing protein
VARAISRLRLWRRSTWFPYALPFLAIFSAALLHFAVVILVGRESTFPFAFFYLIAAFATAWIAGPLPGAAACVLTMVGIPLLASPEFRLAKVNLLQLGSFIAVSLLVSAVARYQRRMQKRLQSANEELDRRVAERTAALASTIELLQSEVDERTRTERALRTSERRVDLTLDAAGIGRWDLDLATGRISRSPMHDRLFGYDEPLPEWTRETLLRHVHPDDRSTLERAFAQALAGTGSVEFDLRIVSSEGEIRRLWVHGKVLRNADGEPVSMLGSLRDITERKVAEERLHAQLARMRLLDHITRGIGERQDLGSMFQVVLRNLEENQLIDFGCVCLYHQSEGVLHVTSLGERSAQLAPALSLEEGGRIAVEANGLTRCVSGQLVYEPDVSQLNVPFARQLAAGGLHSLAAAPLLVAREVFGVMIATRLPANGFASGDCEFLRQLSEHVALAAHQAQARAALQQVNDELRKSQQVVLQQERLRALGQMASGIAHDINNAISPVALYTESLLENEPYLSPRTRQYLETTQRAIEDVAETVARMREFYRQQEPQVALAPVRLESLVQQVLDLTEVRWSDMALRRGATIVAATDLAPDVPAIWGIESEIREALTNLILNAVDAMPKGGQLTLRTGLVPGAIPEVHLSVADTGLGMDEDTRRRCLEPFFTTKGERGTGLGLAMVYGVAQRHNAEVRIESAPGKGTTAILVFPVPEALIPPPGPAPAKVAGRSALKILVVDDDPLLIKSLRDTLEADGHTVTMAHGGNEGIATFEAALGRGDTFSAVMTDLGMPYTDGRKVAHAVKAASPETPVILLTGWGHRLMTDGDVPPDVDRVLSKPPKLRELRAALAECVPEPAAAAIHQLP